MKAVVLEIKDGYAAVLSDDGQFRKIKDEGYAPGMELTLEDIEEKKKSKIIVFRSKRLWQGAAALAAAFLVFVGIKDFNTPYGTISLDVNPSIEISINRYDRVLGIEAVNDDADQIVDELSTYGLKYKSVDTAVDQVLSSFAEGDYAAEDGTTYVMISANSESDSHSDKIVSELDDLCKDHEDISAQTVAADDELLERARELGTTAGKLYLVESLRDASEEEEFDEADWLKKPVRDIMHEISSREGSEPLQEAPEMPEDAPEKPEDAPEKPEDAPEKPEDAQEVPEDAPDENKPEEPQSEPALENDGEPQTEPSQSEAAPPDVPQGEAADENGRQPASDQPEPLDSPEQMQAPGSEAEIPPMAGPDGQAPENMMPPENGNGGEEPPVFPTEN